MTDAQLAQFLLDGSPPAIRESGQVMPSGARRALVEAGAEPFPAADDVPPDWTLIDPQLA